ncbi:MAG: DNA repair protein RecO [Cytophaga sp.]|nr:DNA repair protein RecO [Cytophaga sp.]
MLHKTKGVVFRFTKYGDTSIIVTIFTELFGLQSYIVNGVRSNSPRSKMALYQPLTLLDLVVYHRENAGIMRIKEVRCLYAFQSLNKDVRKSSIAMFMNEIINKCIKEESHTSELCEFLIRSLISLDQMGERVENFHLTFLIQLSRYLGFGPQNTNEVLGGRLVDVHEELVLKELLDSDAFFSNPIASSSRKNILDALIRFYSSHIDGFGDARSVQVLHEILS